MRTLPFLATIILGLFTVTPANAAYRVVDVGCEYPTIVSPNQYLESTIYPTYSPITCNTTAPHTGLAENDTGNATYRIMFQKGTLEEATFWARSQSGNVTSSFGYYTAGNVKTFSTSTVLTTTYRQITFSPSAVAIGIWVNPSSTGLYVDDISATTTENPFSSYTNNFGGGSGGSTYVILNNLGMPVSSTCTFGTGYSNCQNSTGTALLTQNYNLDIFLLVIAFFLGSMTAWKMIKK